VEVQRMDESEKIETLSTAAAESSKFTDKKAQKGKTYAYRIISVGPKGEKSAPSEWTVIAINQ
jgi:hypothetical protein